MQPTSQAAMSGGSAVRTGNGRWCGPERSDYTVVRFRPQGLVLTEKGAARPKRKAAQSRREEGGGLGRTKAGPQDSQSARDRHRMDKTLKKRLGEHLFLEPISAFCRTRKILCQL
jgi:hypothetical protein